MFPACCLCPGSGGEDSKQGCRNDAFWPVFTLFCRVFPGASFVAASQLPAFKLPAAC